MSEFTIPGGTIDKATIKRVKDHFNWSTWTEGISKVSVIPSGGVHWSGQKRELPAVIFEIQKKGYINVSLVQYPKGVIVHYHVFWPHMDKLSKEDWKKQISAIHSELRSLVNVD